MSEREILFRGKRADNGEWIEGYFLPGNERQSLRPCIFVYLPETQSFECFDIDIDTLGEYTSLTDKNGTRIFEKDIVKYKETGLNAFGKMETRETKSIVKYNAPCFSPFETDLYEDYVMPEETEVIGNIYDNPELLKGE